MTEYRAEYWEEHWEAHIPTIVLQSCAYHDAPKNRPHWLTRCQDSVRIWAEQAGYTYQIEGDQLFERNPPWANEKLKGRGPIKSDLARLIWLRDVLSQYERALWLDADVFIFATERFNPCAILSSFQSRTGQGRFLFGRERWVQPHKKGIRFGWQIYQNLCNALCLFERDNPYLEFYLYSALNMINTIDPRFIAPQVIGPKLLTAQNNLTTLSSTTLLGSASVDLLIDLAHGEGPALTLIKEKLKLDPISDRCAALNLCASLVGTQGYQGVLLDEKVLEKAMDHLLKDPFQSI